MHFGLGTDRSARLLEIAWPLGTVLRIENVKADQVLVVREPAGRSAVALGVEWRGWPGSACFFDLQVPEYGAPRAP